mgnify:CR=1 FL=1
MCEATRAAIRAIASRCRPPGPRECRLCNAPLADHQELFCSELHREAMFKSLTDTRGNNEIRRLAGAAPKSYRQALRAARASGG